MKKLPAILASLLITACIALGMFALGANALFNPNGVAFASAPTNGAFAASAITNSAQSGDSSVVQVKQLQDLVAQYQQREQQYQDQLSQSSQQVQQYQNVLEALQQAGVIQIDDGQIFIPRQSGDHD